MRIAGIRTTSIFDGYGINFVIFFQGCHHKCKGCHNPATHDVKDGKDVEISSILTKINEYKDFITGVTFSGGEPLLQPNALIVLSRQIKKLGLSTTLYTGYELGCISPFILENIDTVIDGRFDQRFKAGEHPMRGSSNQNIWIRGKNNEWCKVAD